MTCNSIEGHIAEETFRGMIASGTVFLHEPVRALRIYFPVDRLEGLNIEEDRVNWELAAELLEQAIIDLKSGKPRKPGHRYHCRRFDVEVEEIRVARITIFANDFDEAEVKALNSVEESDFELDCRIPRSIIDYEARQKAIEKARSKKAETV